MTLYDLQDLPEDQDETELDSEQAVTQLPSFVEWMDLSPLQQEEVQDIREKLSCCELYSGVGIVVCEEDALWMPVGSLIERSLVELNYTIITGDIDDSQLDLKTLFTTIAQTRAYPESPAATGSPPFVIAIFVSGQASYSRSTLNTRHGQVNIANDIIEPFLPQSAPHLVHIPKLFFISSFDLGHVDTMSSQPLHDPDQRN